MNCKKLLSLLFAAILCFSFSACNQVEEEPEITPETLAEKSDEQIIDILKKNYSAYHPTALSYEADITYSTAGQTTYATHTEVLVNGTNQRSETEITAPTKTAPVIMTLADGIWYVEGDGQKIKYPAEEEMAIEYPFLMDLSSFTKNTLLRSEDGSYVLVFHQPSNEADSLLNEFMQSEESTVTGFSNAYVSLLFSSGGGLDRVSLGITYTVSLDEVETEMDVLIEYRILSTDPRATAISAPEDADTYSEQTSQEPFEEDEEPEAE